MPKISFDVIQKGKGKHLRKDIEYNLFTPFLFFSIFELRHMAFWALSTKLV